MARWRNDMFSAATFRDRRVALATRLQHGLILIPGADPAPMNFAHNAHPFVQDGTFRYFFGLNIPDLCGLIDAETGAVALAGETATLDDVIWTGATPTLAQEAARVGVAEVLAPSVLQDRLRAARQAGRPVHILPPYRGETVLKLAAWLELDPAAVPQAVSPALVRAVIALREIKSAAEVAEIEGAIAVAARLHHSAMRATRPGVIEREVVAEMAHIVEAEGLQFAYRPIFSARGEVLHNTSWDGCLQAGDLVVNDAGCMGPGGYASDITRTLPVSGRFEGLQRDLYDLVLAAQTQAIAAARPGLPYLALHKLAAQVMVRGLADLGLFTGDPAEIVESGAYAVCFQCGLGHQIGLDVHDMEALGEDHVGYDADHPRSGLFGLRSLRMAKPIQAGMTLTIEPGLYFIPQLLDRWEAEGRFSQWIDYAAFRRGLGVRGIRIEDDVLITATGARILGPPIARARDEVERVMAGGPAPF